MFTLALQAVVAADWPAWRGPSGIGVSSETTLPTRWSTTENVKWRVALPEPGNSTPIVSGGRVFVTQAVGDRRTLMCFDRADGRLLWQQGVTTREKEPTHQTNPYCSGSPVTDGERVIVSFASDGLLCFDRDGRELWRRTDLGRQVHIWGGAASPVIHGDLCFLNFGPGETTYLLAVDKRTGRTVWRHEEETGYGRPPAADVKASPSSKSAKGAKAGVATDIGSWTTPVIVRVDGADQLLVSWPRRLAAYDPRTGRELWTCSGLNPLAYPSPVHAAGIVVAMGGFNGSAFAVRAGGQGDVTTERRLWQHPRTKQRIGSAVVHDGHIYIHNDPGIVVNVDVPVMHDRRADALLRARMLPQPALGRDVALAAGADGERAAVEPAHRDHDARRVHGRRVGEGIEPRAGPEFAAGARIVRGQPPRPAHEQLVRAVHPHDHRRRPRPDVGRHARLRALRALAARARLHVRRGRAAVARFLLVPPHRAARALVDREEVRGLARAEVEKTQVAVDHRRRRAAPDVHLPAEVGAPPEFAAVAVEAEESVGCERHDHPLAVRHGRSGAVRVGLVRRLLLAGGHALLPEQAPIGAIETHQGPPVADRLGDEHPAARDNGSRISRLRQRDAPLHILGGAPPGWERRFRRNADAGRPAPRRPVRGHDRLQGQGEHRGDESGPGFHVGRSGVPEKYPGPPARVNREALAPPAARGGDSGGLRRAGPSPV